MNVSWLWPAFVLRPTNVGFHFERPMLNDGTGATGASPTPAPSQDPDHSTGGGEPATSASTAGAARVMPFRLW